MGPCYLSVIVAWLMCLHGCGAEVFFGKQPSKLTEGRNDEFPNMVSLILCDLNGDGFLDVVNTRRNPSVAGPYYNVLVQSYSFSSSVPDSWTDLSLTDQTTNLSTSKRSLLCLDYDFDGNQDVVLLGSDNVEVLRGISGTATPRYDLDAFVSPNTSVSAQFNNLITLEEPTVVGSKAGTFPNMQSLATAFVNNDSWVDLVFSSWGGLIVLLGQDFSTTGSGFSGNDTAYVYGAPDSSTSEDYLAAFDYDSDRLTDIYLRANNDNNEIGLFTGTGTANNTYFFSKGDPIPISPGNQQYGAVIACDFNNDDQFAILTVSNDGGVISQGGSLELPANLTAFIQIENFSLDFVFDLWCEDLNNDGYAELIYSVASTQSDSNAIQIFENGVNGWEKSADALKTAGPLSVGDVDNDGDQDIFVLFRGNIYLYENMVEVAFDRAIFIGVYHRDPTPSIHNASEDPEIRRSEAMGTKISIYSPDGEQVSGSRFVSGGSHRGSQDPMPLHFGLAVSGSQQALVVRVVPPLTLQPNVELFYVKRSEWSNTRLVKDYVLGGCTSGDNSCCDNEPPTPSARCNYYGQWYIAPSGEGGTETEVLDGTFGSGVMISGNLSLEGTTTVVISEESDTYIVVLGCVEFGGELQVDVGDLDLDGATTLDIFSFNCLGLDSEFDDIQLSGGDGVVCSAEYTTVSLSVVIAPENSDCPGSGDEDSKLAVILGPIAAALCVCVVCVSLVMFVALLAIAALSTAMASLRWRMRARAGPGFIQFDEEDI